MLQLKFFRTCMKCSFSNPITFNDLSIARKVEVQERCHRSGWSSLDLTTFGQGKAYEYHIKTTIASRLLEVLTICLSVLPAIESVLGISLTIERKLAFTKTSTKPS